jgi:hypothetical protein
MLRKLTELRSMNVQQINESKNYRKAARTLLSEVSKLIDEAGKSIDSTERRELYLQAMCISDEAYTLLGKAKKLGPPKTSLRKGQTRSGDKAYLSEDN